MIVFTAVASFRNDFAISGFRSSRALTSSMLVIASSKMRAMSPTSSARDPAGNSPQRSESFFNCFAFAARGVIDHHQAPLSGLNKDIDPLIEDLSFLYQVNFLRRQMISLRSCSRSNDSKTQDEGKNEEYSGDHG